MQVFEAGDGVGGTWYWNRYPGARCDVESMEYSYGFDEELQQEWEWTERYAPQPEILSYANHVADRFDLRRDIQFETKVTARHLRRGRPSTWRVQHRSGRRRDGPLRGHGHRLPQRRQHARHPRRRLVRGPDVPHRPWPHEGVDFTGQRVGVIGTGSSAIQSIPIIAEQAAELTVFQRTATFTVPAWNQPLDPVEVKEIKAEYARVPGREPPDAERVRRPHGAHATSPPSRSATRSAGPSSSAAGSSGGLAVPRRLHRPAARQGRQRHWRPSSCARSSARSSRTPSWSASSPPTRWSAASASASTPATGPRSTRTTCTSSTCARRRSRRSRPTGIRTTAGEHELDAIIYATGFDAMTGALLRIDIRGRDGRTLQDAWAAGPRTYLGLGVEGFPNLFTITGPGSPSVLTNMLVSIQQHVEWIADCIAYLDEQGHATIEASLEAQDAWVDFVNSVAGFTLFPTCNSWYLGANVPGKTRVFMPLPGFPTYVEQCDQVAEDGYAGFVLAG